MSVKIKNNLLSCSKGNLNVILSYSFHLLLFPTWKILFFLALIGFRLKSSWFN